MPTDLRRIVALAYSPKSGNLYVANSPTTDDGHSGIYRIDQMTKPDVSTCTAVRIADVKSPTALAFAPDGALYVTTASDLQKLTGDL
jgi:DNA-binding beta-propeller fold protein YncE